MKEFATYKSTSWYNLSPEEKRAVLDKRLATKDRTRHGHWKGRKHWTEIATPEQLAEWKAKVKAGRDKFYSDRKKGKGRPKKINYKPGWDPAKKAVASREMWEKWKIERPDAAAKFVAYGQMACEKIRELNRIYKAEYNWAKENKVFEDNKARQLQELDELYLKAKMLIADSGIEPEPHMPKEYYEEIINFFTNGAV